MSYLAKTREHELKTHPPFFGHVLDNSKPFELRKNDRGFKVGDTLWLREYSPNKYTGRSCRRVVTYILDLDEWGMPGWVIMGLRCPT